MLVAADSSAIIKLVLTEEGSDIARAVWQDADNVLATRLARIEAAAGVAAARRARRVGRAAESRAHEALASVWESVDVLELDEAAGSLATSLSRLHAISGADAVHLAGAVESGAVLLTWDRRLAAAAVAEGLTVVPQG